MTLRRSARGVIVRRGRNQGTQGIMRRDASRPPRAHRSPCEGSGHRTRGERRLLRRTFLTAFLLLGGGLLTIAGVALSAIMYLRLERARRERVVEVPGAAVQATPAAF